MANMANEIATRVNRFGIGAWLAALPPRIGSGPVPKLDAGQTEDLRAPGLVLRLGRAASRTAGASAIPLDEVVIERASFDGAGLELPFGLYMARETPASAAAKLSADTAGGDPAAVAAGDRRISHVLDNALVAEVAFRSGMTGIEQILIVRLGSPYRYGISP